MSKQEHSDSESSQDRSLQVSTEPSIERNSERSIDRSSPVTPTLEKAQSSEEEDSSDDDSENCNISKKQLKEILLRLSKVCTISKFNLTFVAGKEEAIEQEEERTYC